MTQPGRGNQSNRLPNIKTAHSSIVHPTIPAPASILLTLETDRGDYEFSLQFQVAQKVVDAIQRAIND